MSKLEGTWEGDDAYLVCGDEVADEQEDAHDNVLGDRDDVRAGDLEDLNFALDGGVEVDVVGADTGGDADLQVLGLVDDVLGDICGVEGGRNEDLGLA